MWPSKFEQRLSAWNNLRYDCRQLDTESALTQINQWWHMAPWKAYHLHWDDRPDWPDPWQLLSDNIYCDLARGLGILYTISLLDRADLTSAKLVLTDEGTNLVLVEKEKYILNWDKETIVNTNQEITIKKQLTQSTVKQQYL
jgi:hypothetical protein